MVQNRFILGLHKILISYQSGQKEKPVLRVYDLWDLDSVYGPSKVSSSHKPEAVFLKLYMGARNRVGIGLLYRPARLNRLAESIPWN